MLFLQTWYKSEAAQKHNSAEIPPDGQWKESVPSFKRHISIRVILQKKRQVWEKHVTDLADKIFIPHSKQLLNVVHSVLNIIRVGNGEHVPIYNWFWFVKKTQKKAEINYFYDIHFH